MADESLRGLERRAREAPDDDVAWGIVADAFARGAWTRPRRPATSRTRRGRSNDPFTLLSRARERDIELSRSALIWAGRRAAEAWRLTHGGREPDRIEEECPDGIFNVFCYPRTNDYLALVDEAIDAEQRGDSRRGLGSRARRGETAPGTNPAASRTRRTGQDQWRN